MSKDIKIYGIREYQLLQKNVATRTELLAQMLYRPHDLRVVYVTGEGA
jgi:hypothetical protein